MMIDKKFKKGYHWDHEMVEYRGYVISRTISVEHHLDIIIVKHHFPDSNKKANEFHSNIVSEMTASKKIKTLKGVLKQLGEIGDKKDYNALCGNLVKIFKFRNMIAHWKWSFKLDGDHFTVTKHADKIETIDNARLEEFIGWCASVTAVLSKIYAKHFIKI